MRRFRFLEWLDEATDGPVATVFKTMLAGLVLLSLAVGVYRVVRDSRAELQATNERLSRELKQK